MYVFISHSSTDAEITKKICYDLEAEGIQCFLSSRDIKGGSVYAEEIVDGIDKSDVFLLLLSKKADDSPHVLREVERACSRKIPILVYKLETFEISKAMEYFIMAHQWLEKDAELDTSVIIGTLKELGQKKKQAAASEGGEPAPAEASKPAAPVKTGKPMSKEQKKSIAMIVMAVLLLSLLISCILLFIRLKASTDENSAAQQTISGLNSDKQALTDENNRLNSEITSLNEEIEELNKKLDTYSKLTESGMSFADAGSETEKMAEDAYAAEASELILPDDSSVFDSIISSMGIEGAEMASADTGHSDSVTAADGGTDKAAVSDSTEAPGSGTTGRDSKPSDSVSTGNDSKNTGSGTSDNGSKNTGSGTSGSGSENSGSGSSSDKGTKDTGSGNSSDKGTKDTGSGNSSDKGTKDTGSGNSSDKAAKDTGSKADDTKKTDTGADSKDKASDNTSDDKAQDKTGNTADNETGDSSDKGASDKASNDKGTEQTEAGGSGDKNEVPEEIPVATCIPKDAELGDTVTLGSYYGKPVEWRILHFNSDGTAILVAKNVLCIKPFDVAESGSFNYYGEDLQPLTREQKDNFAALDADIQRQAKGSNSWYDSNIRTWLNSAKENVSYSDTKPTKEATTDYINGYENEAGFLNGFSKEDREFLVPYSFTSKDAATKESHKCSDLVFLLSEKELAWFDEADIRLHAPATPECLEHDKSNLYNAESTPFWWLRDPDTSDAYQVMAVKDRADDETVTSWMASCSIYFGIRPAICVK